MNVKTSRCGDAIVDSGSFNNGFANEQCDLGSANGQTGSLCSATCKSIIVVQEPDVTITKTVVGNTTGYQSGDAITYQLLYRNIGTGLATGIVITDMLPTNMTYVSSTSSAGIGNPTQA